MLASMSCLKVHLAGCLAVPLLACFGCKVEAPDAEIRTGDKVEARDAEVRIGELATALASVDCRTEEDVRLIVANAANSQRAVLFVHVDWAFMEPQRSHFAEFAAQYTRVHPEFGVLFHYADCTPAYAPLAELDGWKELAAGGPLIHGWGEVVWMAGGRVLHVEKIMNFESPLSLIQKTNDLFQTRPSDVK